MRLPLWLTGTRDGIVTLARCHNCGKTKATSNPCGFDHAAALTEFGDALVRAVEHAAPNVDVWWLRDVEPPEPSVSRRHPVFKDDLR